MYSLEFSERTGFPNWRSAFQASPPIRVWVSWSPAPILRRSACARLFDGRMDSDNDGTRRVAGAPVARQGQRLMGHDHGAAQTWRERGPNQCGDDGSLAADSE